jgi:hypothetical protein
MTVEGTVAGVRAVVVGRGSTGEVATDKVAIGGTEVGRTVGNSTGLAIVTGEGEVTFFVNLSPAAGFELVGMLEAEVLIRVTWGLTVILSTFFTVTVALDGAKSAFLAIVRLVAGVAEVALAAFLAMDAGFVILVPDFATLVAKVTTVLGEDVLVIVEEDFSVVRDTPFLPLDTAEIFAGGSSGSSSDWITRFRLIGALDFADMSDLAIGVGLTTIFDVAVFAGSSRAGTGAEAAAKVDSNWSSAIAAGKPSFFLAIKLLGTSFMYAIALLIALLWLLALLSVTARFLSRIPPIAEESWAKECVWQWA